MVKLHLHDPTANILQEMAPSLGTLAAMSKSESRASLITALRTRPDLVLYGIAGQERLLEDLSFLGHFYPELGVIAIADLESDEMVLQVKDYVVDFLVLPLGFERLRFAIERGLQSCWQGRKRERDLALKKQMAEAKKIRSHGLLAHQEKNLILEALEEAAWVQKTAAAKLGISARVLNYKICKFGITYSGWRRNS